MMDHDEFTERFKELVVNAALNVNENKQADNKQILVDYIKDLAVCCMEFYNAIIDAGLKVANTYKLEMAEQLTNTFLAGLLAGAFGYGN